MEREHRQPIPAAEDPLDYDDSPYAGYRESRTRGEAEMEENRRKASAEAEKQDKKNKLGRSILENLNKKGLGPKLRPDKPKSPKQQNMFQ